MTHRIVLKASCGVMFLSVVFLVGPVAGAGHAAAVTTTPPASLLKVELELAQLEAAHPLDPADQQAVLAAASQAYRQEPEVVTRNCRRIETRLRGADAPQRALLRKEALVGLFCHPGPGDPAVQRVVSRLAPMLAVDTQDGIVVTAQDLASVTASNNFVAGLAGLPAAPTPQVSPGMLRLTSATTAQKQDFNLAEYRWASLQQTWAQMSPSIRTRLTAAARRRIHSRAQVPDSARGLETASLTIQRQGGIAAFIRRRQARTRVGSLAATARQRSLMAMQSSIFLESIYANR